LVGNHGEVIELGFKSKVVEKVDFDFHAGLPEYGLNEWRPLSGFSAASLVLFSNGR
jgi:hypothetical protein